MTFSWTMLIAPCAALAGVGITMFFTNLRERAQFQRQLAVRQLDNRRAAYVGFLSASDLVEQTEKRMTFAMEQGAGHKRKATPPEEDLFVKAPDQIAELRRARAVLDIDGSPEQARVGRALYDAHVQFEVIVHAAWLARKYDTAATQKVLGDITSARAAFVHAIRREMALEPLDLLAGDTPELAPS